MGRINGWPSHNDILCDPKLDKMDISLLSTDYRNCEKCVFEADCEHRHDTLASDELATEPQY